MDLQKICDDFFTVGELENGSAPVIMGNPAPDIPIEEIRAIIENDPSERNIADAFAIASNRRLVGKVKVTARAAPI